MIESHILNIYIYIWYILNLRLAKYSPHAVVRSASLQCLNLFWRCNCVRFDFPSHLLTPWDIILPVQSSLHYRYFYRQTWLKTFKILFSFIGNWWRDQYFSLEIKRQIFSRLIPQVYKLWQPVLHWTSINTLCQISSILNHSLRVAIPSTAGGKPSVSA